MNFNCKENYHGWRKQFTKVCAEYASLPRSGDGCQGGRFVLQHGQGERYMDAQWQTRSGFVAYRTDRQSHFERCSLDERYFQCQRFQNVRHGETNFSQRKVQRIETGIVQSEKGKQEVEESEYRRQKSGVSIQTLPVLSPDGCLLTPFPYRTTQWKIKNITNLNCRKKSG